MQLHTYLSFDGNCREAFEFYQRHVGGKVVAMMSFKDGPCPEEMAPEVQDRVMHGCLQIGDHMLMGTDGTPGHPHQEVKGAHVVLSVGDPQEAERVFKVLEEGGRVGMPMEETFWARRFGIVVDRFGVPWMVNCDKEAVTI